MDDPLNNPRRTPPLQDPLVQDPLGTDPGPKLEKLETGTGRIGHSSLSVCCCSQAFFSSAASLTPRIRRLVRMPIGQRYLCSHRRNHRRYRSKQIEPRFGGVLYVPRWRARDGAHEPGLRF